ncbi:hypothetical protein P886_0139 [Alteromonadaceae bacterium 2753L.S.0a.02]|nr:hypothetical protein P886_0139 [Alteromonadaceae bacterium 2753L.S.0a.02]
MIQDFWINNNRLLLTRYTGIVTGQELIDASLKKSGDIRFDQVKFILADWSRVDTVQITPQEVKALVACLRPISLICPYARSASIVNPDPTGNALIAWYKFLADDLTWEVEIFNSQDSAVEWCIEYADFVKQQSM